jgi:ATP-dependent DNA ligase
MSPPTYPLRPTNGGPLPLARPKRGEWAYEPKVNGWRALVHTPTGRMWNRRGKRLSIEHEFSFVLNALQDADLPPEFEWLDCEAFERRHALGKGSLVLLDHIPTNPKTPYSERQQALADTFRELPIWRAWPIEQFSPEENRLLSFAYTYEDCEDPDLAPAAAWERLQKLNQLWNAEVFEGLVAKKLDSTYPRQLRSPNLETPYWIKHRWEF